MCVCFVCKVGNGVLGCLGKPDRGSDFFSQKAHWNAELGRPVGQFFLVDKVFAESNVAKDGLFKSEVELIKDVVNLDACNLLLYRSARGLYPKNVFLIALHQLHDTL
jgi:hypothetical protein